MDQDAGRRTRTYPYSYTRPTCREHHVRYTQTITGLDEAIGGLLADLKKRGLADKTVIVYGSDHGLLMGEHAMGGKSLLYDLASKIPCFVHDPTLSDELRGREVDALVSSLDFPVTLLDYAGVEALEFMDGRSLAPLVQGKSTEEIGWRKDLFLERLYTGRDTPFQEGIRAGKWKYIRMFDGQKPSYDESHVDFAGRKPEFEMLFDLEADPGETNNLIEAHEGEEFLTRFREEVAARSKALNQRREAFRKVVTVTER